MKKRWYILGAVIVLPAALLAWHSDPAQDAITQAVSKSDKDIT